MHNVYGCPLTRRTVSRRTVSQFENQAECSSLQTRYTSSYCFLKGYIRILWYGSAASNHIALSSKYVRQYEAFSILCTTPLYLVHQRRCFSLAQEELRHFGILVVVVNAS